jgi:hypothetical protein
MRDEAVLITPPRHLTPNRKSRSDAQTKASAIRGVPAPVFHL